MKQKKIYLLLFLVFLTVVACSSVFRFRKHSGRGASFISDTGTAETITVPPVDDIARYERMKLR